MNTRGILKSSSLLVVAVLSGSALWFGFSHGQPHSTSVTQPQTLQSDERNTVEVVQRVSQSVVFIAVKSSANIQNLSADQQSNDPFGQSQEGTGAGFVLDVQGHILTNNHVLQGADQITVKFKSDPQNYPAKVLGKVASLDLAIIRVQAPTKLLQPVVLGDSSKVLVGEKAIAIGNPFGLESSVSSGIVSAVRQNPGILDGLVPIFIQTDAAINPGNSGGPLLNSGGEVVGINTAIYAVTGAFGGQPQSAGIGFAIPINLAKQYLKKLEQGQNISDRQVLANRPHIGVAVTPLSAYAPQTRSANHLPDGGLMVQSVEKNSPAQQAGLKASSRFIQAPVPGGSTQQIGLDGDVLLAANGVNLSDINDLRRVLDGLESGQSATFRVLRAGKQIALQITPLLATG